jgi:hypothetical protein
MMGRVAIATRILFLYSKRTKTHERAICGQETKALRLCNITPGRTLVPPKKQIKQNQNKHLELLIETLLCFFFVDDKT